MSRSRSRAAAHTVVRLCGDLARFAAAVVRSHAHLAAENCAGFLTVTALPRSESSVDFTTNIALSELWREADSRRITD